MLLILVIDGIFYYLLFCLWILWSSPLCERVFEVHKCLVSVFNLSLRRCFLTVQINHYNRRYLGSRSFLQIQYSVASGCFCFAYHLLFGFHVNQLFCAASDWLLHKICTKNVLICDSGAQGIRVNFSKLRCMHHLKSE